MDGLKILVVDDESRMRKLVRDFLVKKGYEVMEAQDGEEALEVFYSEPKIALILLLSLEPIAYSNQPEALITSGLFLSILYIFYMMYIDV